MLSYRMEQTVTNTFHDLEWGEKSYFVGIVMCLSGSRPPCSSDYRTVSTQGCCTTKKTDLFLLRQTLFLIHTLLSFSMFILDTMDLGKFSETNQVFQVSVQRTVLLFRTVLKLFKNSFHQLQCKMLQSSEGGEGRVGGNRP